MPAGSTALFHQHAPCPHYFRTISSSILISNSSNGRSLQTLSGPEESAVLQLTNFKGIRHFQGVGEYRFRQRFIQIYQGLYVGLCQSLPTLEEW